MQKKVASFFLLLLMIGLIVGGIAQACSTVISSTTKPAHRVLIEITFQKRQPALIRSGNVVNRTSPGNRNQPKVALTFDDGPDPMYTFQVLDILRRYGVHATFFVVGQRVQSYPGIVQQEYSAGDAVGNHSWNHPDLRLLSNVAVQLQLQNTSTRIQQATGTLPHFFRPPYGAINPRVRQQAVSLGLTPVLWTIDTLDWQRPESRIIVERALNSVKNGSIILMHDGGGDRSRTVAALPLIITQLLQRGFSLETIPQLFSERRK